VNFKVYERNKESKFNSLELALGGKTIILLPRTQWIV
jgi:hypothetical protein